MTCWSGARIEVDPHKEDPLDFVLWKGSKPGEPAWPSPWGPGRPGWHIECSAMSMHYLGETLDLHGGGQDLVFPHHENELAQSEAATGRPFARFWLHHGLLTINQEKMSKSLGNFFTVKEVLARFPAEVVRFFLINGHYRSPLDFSDAALAEAEAALLRLYSTLARLREVLRPYPNFQPLPASDLRGQPEPGGVRPTGVSGEPLRGGHGRRPQHRPGPGLSLRRGAPAQPPAGATLRAARLPHHALGELPFPGELGRVLNLLQADPEEMARPCGRRPRT